MHEYAKWLDPLQNRRQSILEESHLRVFTQLNDYHAVVERDLTCIIFSCIYNGNLVAKTVWDNLSVCRYAKPGFAFLWSRDVFRRIFVRSVATGNANAKECRSITILFGKSPTF